MNKSELIAGLQEEYRGWQALLDQIGLGNMVQPGVAGHWSIKDIVAHLTGWRKRPVARLQAAQRGDPEPSHPWPAHLQTDDEINAWIYEANHKRPLREVSVLTEGLRYSPRMLKNMIPKKPMVLTSSLVNGLRANQKQ